MVRELMHDPIFLAGKSEIATKEDLQVAQDLLDMLMVCGFVSLASLYRGQLLRRKETRSQFLFQPLRNTRRER